MVNLSGSLLYSSTSTEDSASQVGAALSLLHGELHLFDLLLKKPQKIAQFAFRVLLSDDAQGARLHGGEIRPEYTPSIYTGVPFLSL